MLPSNVNQWWHHHPNIDYSVKHSFSWPNAAAASEAGAAAGAAGAAAGAAGSGAKAAEGAHFGGGPPRGPGNLHYYEHWHGRGFPHRWRRGPSRLVWFLVGVGATVWYMKAKDRKREWERSMGLTEKPWCGPGHEWKAHWERNQQSQQSQQNQPHTPFVPVPPTPTQAAQATTPAPAAAAPTAEPQAPTPTPSPVLSAVQKDSESGGWGLWRRKSPEEKWDNLIEALKKDKKVAALVQHIQQDDQAREDAKAKLDKLSAALEAIRDSLKDDKEKRI